MLEALRLRLLGARNADMAPGAREASPRATGPKVAVTRAPAHARSRRDLGDATTCSLLVHQNAGDRSHFGVDRVPQRVLLNANLPSAALFTTFCSLHFGRDFESILALAFASNGSVPQRIWCEQRAGRGFDARRNSRNVADLDAPRGSCRDAEMFTVSREISTGEQPGGSPKHAQMRTVLRSSPDRGPKNRKCEPRERVRGAHRETDGSRLP